MIRKNLLKSPVFSCLWLAGIVLIRPAMAEDGWQKPVAATIIPQRQALAKSPDRQVDRHTEFAEMSEGISIGRSANWRITGNLPAVQQTTPDTDAELPASQTPDETTQQPLFSSLSSVTLADAGRLETLDGDQLDPPDDQARPMVAEFGMWYDVSGYRTIRGAGHCQHPVWYNPLYFEDPNMERCGVSDGCLTDFVSATRFFGRSALLPYMIGSNEPHSCVRSLGDCPTCHQFGKDAYIAPLNAKGVALQTACTIGLVFLIP